MSTFIAYGSWGMLTCDAETGKVLTYDNEQDDNYVNVGEGYNDIRRLDVDEWRRAYPGEALEGGHWDILDFGYWWECEYRGLQYEWPAYGRTTKWARSHE